jgi:hypothetical protein
VAIPELRQDLLTMKREATLLAKSIGAERFIETSIAVHLPFSLVGLAGVPDKYCWFMQKEAFHSIEPMLMGLMRPKLLERRNTLEKAKYQAEVGSLAVKRAIGFTI